MHVMEAVLDANVKGCIIKGLNVCKSCQGPIQGGLQMSVVILDL
jgi:hypothetical protein